MYGIVICENGNVYEAKNRRHFKWLKWYYGWIYGLKMAERYN